VTDKDNILQGLEHLGKGRLDKAERYFRRAIGESPDDLSAHNNLALTLARKGEKKEAVKILKKALKKCDHDNGFYRTMRSNISRINRNDIPVQEQYNDTPEKETAGKE